MTSYRGHCAWCLDGNADREPDASACSCAKRGDCGLCEQALGHLQPFLGGDPSEHYRDRIVVGAWSRNGIRKGGPKRPPKPRDGAWAQRLEEIRAEREAAWGRP